MSSHEQHGCLEPDGGYNVWYGNDEEEQVEWAYNI